MTGADLSHNAWLGRAHNLLHRMVTWNLGAAEPFEKGRGKAPRHLEPFVPPGYDLYAVAVQEGKFPL